MFEQENPVFYNVTLAPEPLYGDIFDLLVVTGLKNTEYTDVSSLSLGFSPERKDGISCIQASPMTAGSGTFRVEVIVNCYDGRKFHIFARNDVPREETLDLFYRTCVEFDTPDYQSWRDVTDEVTYEGGFIP